MYRQIVHFLQGQVLVRIECAKTAGDAQLQLDDAGNAVHVLPQPAPHRRRKARVMLCNPGRVWYNTKSNL